MLIGSYLIGWMLGGIVLMTTLLMRAALRPYALSFALIGYGGAGFLAHGSGQQPVLPSVAGALALGLVGYLLQPRRPSHPPES